MKQYSSEDIKELAAALAGVHAEMEPAKKDSDNPHFKSTYADIRAVVEVSRKLLSKHDLVVTQTVDYEGEGVFLITQITHKSGQFMRSWYPVKPTKNDPQALGSAITYARRYAYCALVGVVADDDDDGNEGSKKEAKPETKPAEPKGEFDTPSLREQFTANCIDAINRAETLEGLKDQKTLNLAKWGAMGKSPHPKDVDAQIAIVKAYNAKLETFKKQSTVTVEAAKKNPAAVLGDDTIAY